MSRQHLRSRFGMLALTAGMLMLPGAAFGQVAPSFFVSILFDENCNGTIANSAGFSAPLTCGLINDPGPGGFNNALFYNMQNPPGLVAGDLRIFEPGGGGLSDILRFDPNVQGGGVFVYSDITPGEFGDLADIGFPLGLYANVLDVTEVGPEGNNGFVYTPLPGQPGYVSGAPQTQVTYTFISDTPEPGTIGLMAGGSVLLYWRRRRSA